ncbi:MAG: fused PTS fructose transporter subunit IIA/HPr protein [Vibrionaceae bacterium]
MLKLTSADVSLGAQAADKTQAIHELASALEAKGFVDSGYHRAMLDREQQVTTYLGSGIAIPHGTLATRSLVKKTGVHLLYFPQGVDWQDDNTVYLAIGIAACSDEHLTILQQLAGILATDGIEERLKNASCCDDILALFDTDKTLPLLFNERLISAKFPAAHFLPLQAQAASLLHAQDAVDSNVMQSLLASEAVHVGKGLWTVSAAQNSGPTAISFVSTLNAFTYQNRPVRGLLAIAAADEQYTTILNKVSQMLQTNTVEQLFTAADSHAVLALLHSESSVEASPEEAPSSAAATTKRFVIKNRQGLHARPGALLVSVCKKFAAQLTVRNISTESDTVNAKSLMRLIALGVRCGDELEFYAEGDDAAQALTAIGEAIDDGLGEKI